MTVREEDYQSYFEALRAGRKGECYGWVQTWLAGNMAVRELYLAVFQRSLYEIGYLWETNRVSVAVEHIATAITENLLSLVYPRIFGADHCGCKAVISCLAREYHQLGGKMVADIFELHGWDGYFLGANTPLSQLCSIVEEKDPDLLALSVSVAAHLKELDGVLAHLRERYPSLPVLLGGRAFQVGEGSSVFNQPGVLYVDSLTTLEDMLEGGSLSELCQSGGGRI
ncbi:cobalamin-binding protein [Alkalispirochaeta sphaeroplastigenens]|uniref:Cobalamin-binding protein n=1 Tax=Alkalispirochaeta sphaeroplastigenens TaxID=1187066 RepID=A0A2S4JPR6_9SPIO|nr:cobalamin-dependent protein [Alkalispirochaeta sphaeroplastigenens]POR01495.1 cobalamin-binding protein [Alkalispirochaeta sphaeroplastigenens]